jgi:hypothetical protein
LISFNAILEHESIDPKGVQLVRHKDSRAEKGRSPYALWRSDPAALDLYQSIQSKARFVVGAHVATFVVSPAGETLFVGLYTVRGVGSVPGGVVDPVSGEDVSGLHLYDLVLDDRLADYRGLLVVDWGKGFLAWVQKAGKNDKRILEIRRKVVNPPFPGFTDFRHDVDTIESIPESWKEILSAVKGVYVLVCKDTGKLYVGSAKGDESLWGRFAQYAANGHGGNVELKARGSKPYQVSVLEVANSGHGIERLEEAWKRKLLSREFGLNDPVLRVNLAAIASFADIFASVDFAFGRWSGRETTDGVATLPWVEWSHELEAFVQAAHDGGFVLEAFAWMDWKDSKEARRLRDSPGAVEKASARQLAQILTVLIRGERFSEGTLSGAFDSGLLQRIVRRAASLVA